MKKNKFLVPLNRNWKKLLLTMKLCLLFLLISVTTLMANSGYSQNTTLSLHLKNATLREFIQEVEKQSEFIFVFYDEVVNLEKEIDIQAEGQTIDKILDKIFETSDLTYRIFDRQIGIGKRNPVTGTIELPYSLAALVSPDKKLTGSVKDYKGNPIPGTTVIVKNRTIGTITDDKGEFVLNVPQDAKTLIFSFVGFKSQEISIDNQASFKIIMEEVPVGVDEVVVVAYGTQKKVSVTGAVASVSVDQLKQSSSASLANSLAGRLPGLTSIASGGSQPGFDDATLYLRGAATTNGTSPLILIDGVPRDNIRTIDANEVESVSILKDASSTAVFGVRGANGVILITTKRGVDGKPALSVNAVQSYSSFTTEPERIHSLEYMKLRNEAAANDGIAPIFSQEVIDRYTNPLAGLDPNDPDYARKAMARQYMYPDHDYYREFISRYAPQTRISANARGGTEKIGYFVNATYLHQGGNLNTEPESVLRYDPSCKVDRYSFRTNLDYKVSNSVKAFLNLGTYIEKVNMPSAVNLYSGDRNKMIRDLIYQAQTILPITPGPVTLAGFGVDPGQIVDPEYLDRSAFEIMNRRGYRNDVRSNLNSSFGVDWDLGNIITPGLTIKGMVSYDTQAVSSEDGHKSERLYVAQISPTTNELTYPVKNPTESLLTITRSVSTRYNINLQGSVNYNRTFGKHAVSGMFLAQRDNWETNSAEIPYNVVGLCGRFTYNYAGRYLAEVNMGYNGSEQFAPDNRFGFFPAVSLGWVMSNERFLRNNRVLTNLKLRGSYGEVGNDQIGSARFLYQDNITIASGGFISSLGKGYKVNEGLLGNHSIAWEVAKKQNYGMDMQLLGNINLTFDYFIENRRDILISRGTIPIFQGVPIANIPKVNMGKVDNSGYEIELRYKKELTKDFSVAITANYGFNHNKVKFLDEQIRDETYSMRYASTGLPLKQASGYAIDYSNGNGYFNSKAELDEYLSRIKYGFGIPRVGDFKYVDKNGDGVINDKDIVPIGYSGIPEITYGATLSMRFKSFDFTAFFQGVGHFSTVYQAQGVYENIKLGTYFGYHKTAWTAERYANGEKITYPALSTGSTTNHTANSFFIMERSFTRLKNIELAYTMPKGTLKMAGVSKIRIFIGAENLFTWASHWKLKHLDVEDNDAIGYPMTKMTNFGVDITF